MAEEEEKHEHHEEHHKGEHGKHDEHGKHKEKNNLLWWGLGIGGAGLLLTLFLVSKGSNSSQDQSSQGGTIQPGATLGSQPGYDASAMDYWPYLNNTSQYPGGAGSTSGSGNSSGGGSSSSGGGSTKKSGGGSTKKSGGGSTKKGSGGSTNKGTSGGTKGTSGGHTKITTTGGHTIVTPNPTAGGAHGWVYTTKAGDTIQGLQGKAWNNTIPLLKYANNAQLLKGKFNKQTGAIVPGTKVVL